MRGLHVKPLTVVVTARGVLFNGNRKSIKSVLHLIRRSQNLLPVPDILVQVSSSDLALGKRFMARVSNEGFCNGRKCLYQVVN